MCLLEEELCANKLPELQNQLNSQTQQLMELQMQHQQVKQEQSHLERLEPDVFGVSHVC